MDADMMTTRRSAKIAYSAAFIAAFVMPAYLAYALGLPPMDAIDENPINSIGYERVAAALLALFLFILIYGYIKYKRARMDLPTPENSAVQQPLKDARAASEYLASKKKVFEDAKTEYLIERLKEAKKKVK